MHSPSPHRMSGEARRHDNARGNVKARRVYSDSCTALIPPARESPGGVPPGKGSGVNAKFAQLLPCQPVALTPEPAPATMRPSLLEPVSGDMKNGLYSIHVSLLDGRVGKGSGVVVFRDGKIVGGDAYLYYTGTYTVKDNTFKGEVLIRRHTSSKDDNPLFGGPNPVGVGVSGTFTDKDAVMNGTALVGRSSQLFGATLRRLADID